MLTFLFALAGIWTLYWFAKLILNWGDRTSLTDSNALCPTCANALKPGSASIKSSDSSVAKSDTVNTVTTQPANQNFVHQPTTAANVSSLSAAVSDSSNMVNKPVTDKHDQSNATPLFEKPNEVDDLKIIKGIGVVMEKTLNDLGITTFKQLSGFERAEVKMVSDVLSESNSGFGDRIDRDEWVDQAKLLVRKAS